MTDITVYQPPPPTHPARELAAALLRRPATWAVVVTLLAFGLRVWALESVPPGWRDDELIETLVISQKILDGDLAFYYPDASGHEALYHALNAIFLAFFGPTGLGIRLLSTILGTLAVPADATPGDYPLAVGVYTRPDGARLRLANGGDMVTLATLIVAAPEGDD